MAYGICRIQKIKSWGELAGSGYHTTRERETLNADPELDNIRVIGEPNDPDLATMVREKIGDQTIRKNAVLAVEILLSASPEYFRPDDPSSAGVYEQQQLDAWTNKSVDWLKEQYQDRVVRAELHLDESTPHIHAYLVPLDDQEKLNCRALFGGSRGIATIREKFRHLQRNADNGYFSAPNQVESDSPAENYHCLKWNLVANHRNVSNPYSDVEKLSNFA